jgi:hypothetical protein
MRGLLAWLRGVFLGLGEDRPPIDGPHDLHRYFHRLAKEAGGARQQLVPEQLATGAQQVTVGTFDARQQRRTRRRRARFARLDRRASAHPPVEWLGARSGKFFDPLVSRVIVYVLSFGAFVTILESTGTYATLSVFDGVLKEFQAPLAIASGVILFLSGHSCGHLLFSAVKAEKLAKTISFAVAAALIAAAVIAIAWTGFNRSANEEARSGIDQSSELAAQAGRLESDAKELETAKPRASEDVERPSQASLRQAEKLREDAKDLRATAIDLEQEALSRRSLDFLAGIQLVGFIVGIAGGWLFSEATPLRIARMRSRAAKIGAHVNSVVEDEASAAGEAYGHFQSRLALNGVDISIWGAPDFELERRLLHEQYLKPSENGWVKPEMKGGPV